MTRTLRILIDLAPAWIALFIIIQPSTGHADPSVFFPPDNVSVLDRPRPDYEAVGVAVGDFTFYPKLSLDGEYDDNIFATAKPIGDFIWSVAPSLSLVSDWSRNALSLDASLERDEYAGHSILNDTSWTLGLNGRVDVSPGLTVSASADDQRDIEPKTSPNNIPGIAAANISYDLADGHISSVYQVGRSRFTGALNAFEWRYQPDKTETGVAIDEAQRNHEQYDLSGRYDYALSPKTALFLEANGVERQYDQQPSATSIDRNSTGYSALVGLHFELSHLIDGEAGVGYINWDYADPAARKFSGLDGSAKINWYPTQLITVIFNAARTVQDSGLPDVAGYVDNDLSLHADYELLRNLILSGELESSEFAYVDISRDDQRYSASFRASYLITHHLGLGLTYHHLSATSSGSARGIDFDDDRVTVELILQR